MHTPGSLWTIGADGAYSTTTDMVALPHLRRDMRSASKSASRDRSGPADGSDSDGSDDGSAEGSDGGSDWVMHTFSAGGPSSRRAIERRDRAFEGLRARTTARRERQARIQARTERSAQLHLQTPPPATADAGPSSAGRTTKRQKITRSGCSF
jgi:hypothetical protein